MTKIFETGMGIDIVKFPMVLILEVFDSRGSIVREVMNDPRLTCLANWSFARAILARQGTSNLPPINNLVDTDC